MRPDWPTADVHFARALALDPNDALAHAYTAFHSGMLGDCATSAAAAARAVAADPLSTFVRAVSVMGFPRTGTPECDSAAALRAHEVALAMDPNAVVHLWQSAIRLSEFGRFDEALERTRRAVELTQRGPVLVGIHGGILGRAGRREEALAIRAELTDRARTEYIGPGIFLAMDGHDLGDDDETANLLRSNVDAETGPSAIYLVAAPKLDLLLTHPRLGPLVRQLSLYAERPGLPPMPAGQ
jgi:tetratricopeptide (TPR) repeat protein